MKVKNIVFSGVMGAILMGATGAHAAINVASQGYVDAKVAKDVAALGTTVSTTYQTKADAQAAASGVTQALAGKADKGTTLEAYGITDAYTKTAADEKFMIINSDTALGDNLKWEGGKLTTDGIATDQSFSTLETAVNKLNGGADVDGSVANTIAGALENAEASAFSESVQESLGKADSAVQSVTAGTADGTIAVDGTDVAVTGLGSAAYTDAGAYDVAGSAAAVEAKLADYTKTTDLDSGFVTEAEMTSFKSENDTAIADAKKAGTDANTALESYKTTNNAAVEAAKNQADKGVADAAKAQAAADKAQGEVDSLEGKVSTLQSDLATKIEAPEACETQDCVLSINKASGTITWVPLTEPTADFLN